MMIPITPKFKVGDKVTISNHSAFRPDFVFEITFRDNWQYHLSSKGFNVQWHFKWQDQLVLVEESKKYVLYHKFYDTRTEAYTVKAWNGKDWIYTELYNPLVFTSILSAYKALGEFGYTSTLDSVYFVGVQ